jgi:hypothetical protein
MYKLIILTGKKQSGKDTVGNYLVEKYGYNRIGLADPVKDAYYAQNPWVFVSGDEIAKLSLPVEAMYTRTCTELVGVFVKVQQLVEMVGWDTAKQCADVREGLQLRGTEGGRDIHGENCWLEIADKKLTGHDVITDGRFPNEVDFGKERGGLVINLYRPGQDTADTHASETSICSECVDVIITNDGTVEELYDEIDRLFE